MGLFSSSKSSSSTTVSDQSIKGEDALVNVGGGTQGNVTVVADSQGVLDLADTVIRSADFQFSRNIDLSADTIRQSRALIENVTDRAFDVTQSVVRDGFDFGEESLDLVGETTENALDFADSRADDLTYAYTSFSDTLAAIQGNAFDNFQEIKQNEQLGEVTQVKEIAKIAAIAAVAYVSIPAVLGVFKK